MTGLVTLYKPDGGVLEYENTRGFMTANGVTTFKVKDDPVSKVETEIHTSLPFLYQQDVYLR